MAEQAAITDFTLGPDAGVADGDALRVRPWQPPATTFGQGTNAGPRIGGVQLHWGKPVTVSAAGDITPELVQQHPDLFMTEDRYQDHQSSISNEQD